MIRVEIWEDPTGKRMGHDPDIIVDVDDDGTIEKADGYHVMTDRYLDMPLSIITENQSLLNQVMREFYRQREHARLVQSEDFDKDSLPGRLG